MIVKVKEPLESEYSLIRSGQIVFTYFHFASYKPLLEAMVKSKAICIAYETVEDSLGRLPLLIPMSEVAGRMSIQEGAKYLEKPLGGKGILLGGVPGVEPAKVVILGGGVVGTEAAKIASGMGSKVYILDVNLNRLKHLSEILPKNVIPLFSNQYNINRLIKDADIVIGGVLIPGGKAPKLITREMLKEMQDGVVLVDVAVDQGGCIETCRPTTHEAPTFVIDGVVHYCVANMPGAVPYTSTVALNNATFGYVKKIADKGWELACKEDKGLCRGLNVVKGKIVYEAVANAFNRPYKAIC
ncbi:alanine dehydrogenase [Elysia marginata]|uniref:alanine dehydrogenase n=1 Tax=Elysia marginata TaxID=1093978 RepID=A0AAV4FWL0_9GAST|nr:alanine dehydrogenase [Elysia marginata]